MLDKLFDHVYIVLTIILTVYSQLVIRWQASLEGALPASTSGKVDFVMSLLINPWVFSAIIATFFAGVSWMLAMTKFEISYAFPFVSLNYVIILFASFFVFNEQLSVAKLVGSLIVVLGIVVIAKG